MQPDETLSTSQTLGSSRAKCGQCGKELRHVPFLLKNIMCRECYGMERYRRSGGMIAPDRSAGAADEAVTA